MFGKKIRAIVIVFMSFLLVGCDALFGMISTETTTQSEITTTTQSTDISSDISTTTIPITITNTSTLTTNQSTASITTTSSDVSNLTQRLTFIYNLAVDSGDFDGTYEEWLETVRGPQGLPGENGKDIVLQVAGGFIQWKYYEESVWTNLVELASLVGPAGNDGVDGKEVIFQVSEGFIQWQYVGDTLWKNLIDLETIMGQDGVDGREVLFQVGDGYIQWKFTGDTSWTNLVELTTLVGPAGNDGKEVLLRVESGYIQWQHLGDTSWENLIELDSLTGVGNITITDTSFNELGELIITYSDGSEYNLGTITTLYTVNFLDYNGYMLDSQRVSYGASVIAPTEPNREGYTFTGWSEDFTNIIGNLDIYAEYSVNTYTVDFITGVEGHTVLTDYNVEHGATRQYPTFGRLGYKFLGWFISSSNKPFYNDTPITEDITLVAKWEKINYTANFIGMNDELIGSYTFTIDDKIYYPIAPKLEGYRFVKWSLEFEYISELILNDEHENSDDIINIFAIYTGPLTISFETNGGVPIPDMTNVYPGNLILLPLAVKDFHGFLGWYKDVDLTIPFNDLLMPNDNLTLYAKYSYTPVILGASDLFISVNSNFDPLEGVIAYDQEDGFIDEITYSMTYDVSVPGDYIINYYVTDSEGIETVHFRNLTVTEMTAVYPSGLFSFYYASTSLRNTFMAAAERYLLENLYGGIPLNTSSTPEIFSSRIELAECLPLPVIGNPEYMTLMLEDDSNYEFYRTGYGESEKRTFRTAIENNNLPNSWNQWENQNAVYDSLFSLFVESLYEKSFNEETLQYEIKPALADSLPVAINPKDNASGVVTSGTWQISLKPDLVWDYHPDLDTSILPLGHETLDAYDIYNSIKFALDNNWYQAVSGLNNFINSNIKIVGAEEYLEGSIDWENVGIKVVDNLTLEFSFHYNLSAYHIIEAFSDINLAPINTTLIDYYGYVPYDFTQFSYSGPYSIINILEVIEETDYPVATFNKNTQYFNPDWVVIDGYHVTFTTADYEMFENGLLDHVKLTVTEAQSQLFNVNLTYKNNPTTYNMAINSLGSIENQLAYFPDSIYAPEPILANLNFKKAMYHAINRLDINEDNYTGFWPQNTYYSDLYYVDPISGIPYRNSLEGMEVSAGLYPEYYGFNPTAAKAYFILAIEELVAQGIYDKGTSGSYNTIYLDLLLMPGLNTEKIGQQIKRDFESIFVSYEHFINVSVIVKTVSFPDIYYNHILKGEFDLAIGGLSGSEFYAPLYMDAFCDYNPTGFQMNWGIDTSSLNIPVYYIDDFGNQRFELWSYNNITAAFADEIYLSEGQLSDLMLELFEIYMPEEVYGYDYRLLPDYSPYGNSISWNVLSGDAVITDNEIVFGNPTTDFEVQLEATISDGVNTATHVFIITINPIPIVDNFIDFYVATGADYDIADGDIVAITGIVINFFEDIYFYVLDENGNTIVVEQYEGIPVSIGDEIFLIGSVSTQQEKRVIIPSTPVKIISVNNEVLITIITPSDFLDIGVTDYGKPFSFTGFELMDKTNGEISLSANDGLNYFYLHIWPYYENEWEFIAFDLDTVIPESHFFISGIYPEMNSYWITDFTIIEAEASRMTYEEEIELTMQALYDTSANFDTYDIFNNVQTDINFIYNETTLYAISPDNFMNPFIDDIEVFLEYLYLSSGNTITKISYITNIDFHEFVWDESGGTGALWYELGGSRYLMDYLIDDINAGATSVMLILNNGTNYNLCLNLNFTINFDILSDYENMLYDSYYLLYNNPNIYNVYHNNYDTETKVRIYSHAIIGEQYDFIHDYIITFINNLYPNKGDIDLSTVTFMDEIYSYDLVSNEWIGTTGNRLFDDLYSLLQDYWVVQDFPVNTLLFTLSDSSGYSLDIVVSVYFEI